MQTETLYLWEVSQLNHTMADREDPITALQAGECLNRHFYPRMQDYGFETKEELLEAVECLRTGKIDPNIEIRALRVQERLGPGEKPPPDDRQEYSPGHLMRLDKLFADLKGERPSLGQVTLFGIREKFYSIKDALGYGKDKQKSQKDVEKDLEPDRG